jgi:hypothetical protein
MEQIDILRHAVEALERMNGQPFAWPEGDPSGCYPIAM